MFSMTPIEDGVRVEGVCPDIKVQIHGVFIEGSRIGLGKSHFMNNVLIPRLNDIYDIIINIDDVLYASACPLYPYVDPNPFGGVNQEGSLIRQMQLCAGYAGFINGMLRSELIKITKPGLTKICIVASRYHLRGAIVFVDELRSYMLGGDSTELNRIVNFFGSMFKKTLTVMSGIWVLDMESCIVNDKLDEYCYTNMTNRGRSFESELYPNLEQFSLFFKDTEKCVWPMQGEVFDFDNAPSVTTRSGKFNRRVHKPDNFYIYSAIREHRVGTIDDVNSLLDSAVSDIVNDLCTL